LLLDVFDLIESHAFLIDDFLLEFGDLLLHDLGLLAIQLLEGGPLPLHQLDVKPLLRELVPLRYQELVPRLVLFELLPPGLVGVLHLLDLGDEHGDVVADVDGQRLQLPPGLLHLLVEGHEVLQERGPELIQDVAVPLVILVVDLRLHPPVVDDEGAEGLLGLRVVEGLPTLPDLVQDLLPLLYVLIQDVENVRCVYIP
jgi:hypothetical protein